MRPARIVALALIVLTSAGCPDDGAPSDVGIETQVPIRPASNGKIAFLLGSAGILGPSPLYVAGSNTPARRIGDGDITSFAWSPDGTRIVYVQAAGEFGGGWIKMVGADGSANRTLVRSSTPLSGISWSPDGRWIVYGQGIGMAPNADNRYRLFAKPTTGGDPIRLTGGPPPHENVLPAWSPDGTRIAYLSVSLFALATASITVIAADGSGATQILSRSGPRMSGPAWSPDGRWLVVVDGEQVRLVRPDGSGSHVIYECRWDCASGAPTWSPDGSEIALTVYHGGRWRIVTITPTGKRVPVPVGLLPRACCLAWQPVPR
jgi:Tol biopolymer transport system component